METAQVEILINGEVTNTVIKPVTVAEAVILKRLHGADCLLNIRSLPDRNVTDVAEIERLRSVYTEKVVNKAFPGSIPRLPKTFAEVDIAVEDAAPRGRPAKAKAEAAQAD